MTTQQQSYADDTDSAPDSTTAPDDWTTLPEDQAALWRALDAWQGNFGNEAAAAIRRARAAIARGNLDALGDPYDLLTAAQKALDTLRRTGDASAPLAATLGDLAGAYWQHIAEQRDAIPTGLNFLDRALGGGLQPGRLMVLLGAPGKGKTTLANQIAEHIASAGRPVLYVTMEDPAMVLLAKTVARVGNLDYGAVLHGRRDLKAQIDATLAQVAARKSATRLLYIEQTGRFNPASLQAQAAEHFARYADTTDSGGPGLLVVDYLQKAARAIPAESPQDDRRKQVTDLTDILRDMGRALGCTVLALGAQNRVGYGTGNNTLASGKESGDIEYGCDVLAAIGEHVGKDGKTPARTAPVGCKAWALHLAKNRQGPLGVLGLDWKPSRQHFTAATEAEAE